MPTFENRFRVQAPIAAVRRFHQRSDALRRLMPPGVIAQIHAYGEMKDGMLADFTLWFGPIPIRWRALHVDVHQNGFTDVQQSGPLDAWRHTHTFVPVGEMETDVIDRIEYTHPTGWRGWLTRLAFGGVALRFLFAYRAFATRRGSR